MKQTHGSLLGFVLLAIVGCSTASSLGLPLSQGPHRLSKTADEFRHAAGLAVPLPRELAKTVVPDYRVEPGDVLIVEPNKFDSTIRLPGDQPVLPDGRIELGRFGRLAVAGKTLDEVEADVQAAIEGQLRAQAEQRDESQPDESPPNGPLAERNGSVSVRLVSRESKVFYVVGEVNAPGAYPLAGRETILDALMAAGGLTDRANEHKIIFSRPTAPEDCRVVLPVCYRQIVQLGDSATNYQMMPGDRIYVPSMTFHDDLKQCLLMFREESCPRCAAEQRTCFTCEACRGSHPENSR